MNAKEDELEKVEELNDELVKEPGVDPGKVKKNISDLKHKHGKVKDNVKDKKEKLVEYIIIIEEYYIIIEEITEWIIITKKKPALNEPIATEPKTLKKQLKDLEVRNQPNSENSLIEIGYCTVPCERCSSL